MSARWWTLFVWALAAGSALFWGLKIMARPLPVPAQAQLADPGGGLRGDLGRLLGADAAPAPTDEPAEAVPEPDSRFTLLGVVSPRAPRAASEGLALIVVDDKPARAYRVGAVVDGDQVLQSVDARGATLGPRGGPARVSLRLAPPAPAATGIPSAAPPPGLPPGAAARFGTPVVPLQRPQAPLLPTAPQVQEENND